VLHDKREELHVLADGLAAPVQKLQVVLKHRALQPLEAPFERKLDDARLASARLARGREQVEAHEDVALPGAVAHDLAVDHRPRAERLPELLHPGHREGLESPIEQHRRRARPLPRRNREEISHAVGLFRDQIAFALAALEHAAAEADRHRPGELEALHVEPVDLVPPERPHARTPRRQLQLHALHLRERPRRLPRPARRCHAPRRRSGGAPMGHTRHCRG